MEKITPKENAALAFQHKKSLWIPIWKEDMLPVVPSAFKDRYLGTVENPEGTDDFGVKYTYCPDIKAPMPLETDLVLTDLESWREQVHFPDPDAMDWAAAAERDLAGKDRKNCFIYVNLIRSQFERLHSLMGFEEALIALCEEPEFIEEYLEAYMEWRLKIVDKVAEYYKPDAIMFNDDYASAGGLLMSPSCWRSMFKPCMKQLADRVHSHGAYVIFHCCGKMEPIFPDFVEVGADAVQIQTLNDIPALKKQYGDRVTFLGCMDNINIMDRPGASEEECVREVRRVINDLAAEGSYAMMQNFFSPLANTVSARELSAYNRPLKEKFMRLDG